MDKVELIERIKEKLYEIKNKNIDLETLKTLVGQANKMFVESTKISITREDRVEFGKLKEELRKYLVQGIYESTVVLNKEFNEHIVASEYEGNKEADIQEILNSANNEDEKVVYYFNLYKMGMIEVEDIPEDICINLIKKFSDTEVIHLDICQRMNGVLDEETLNRLILKNTETMFELEPYEIADKITTISNEEERLQFLSEYDVVLNDILKKEIINTVEDKGKRIRLLLSTSGIELTDAELIEGVKLIDSDDEKLQLLLEYKDTLSVNQKKGIIYTLEDKDKRAKMLFDNSDIKLTKEEEIDNINSISDELERIKITKERRGWEGSDGKHHTDFSGIAEKLKDNGIIEKLLSDKEEKLNNEIASHLIANLNDSSKRKKYLNLYKSNVDFISQYALHLIDKKDSNLMQELLKIDNLRDEIRDEVRSLLTKAMCDIEIEKDESEILEEIRENSKVEDKEYFYSMLKRLKENNDKVFQTIDFRILQDKYKELGFEKINMIVPFEENQKNILNMDSCKFDLAIEILNRLQEQTQNPINISNRIFQNMNTDSFRELMEDISNIQMDEIRLDDGVMKNLIKILNQPNYFNIASLEDVKNYEKIKDEVCSLMLEAKTGEEKRSLRNIYKELPGPDQSFHQFAVCSKLYGISLEHMKFIEYIDYIDVDEFNEEKEILEYVQNIKDICSCHDLELLKKMFTQRDGQDIDMKLESVIEEEISRIYAEEFDKTLYRPQETKRISNYNGMEDAENIPIYSAGTDFSIMLTSVGAVYGNGKDRKTNFKDDWNIANMESSNICCSYIRNDMIGTASIKNICYGFLEPQNAGIEGMIESDGGTGTKTDGTTMAQRNYCAPNTFINNTQEGFFAYNEINLKRRYVDKNGEITKTQPDYIVYIKDERDDKAKSAEIWRNCIQASKDFAIDGNPMPIVIIDVQYCIKAEQEKIKQLYEKYKESGELEVLEALFQKIKNNSKSSRTRDDFGSDMKFDYAKKVFDHLTKNNEIEKQNMQMIQEVLYDVIKNPSKQTTKETMDEAKIMYDNIKNIQKNLENKEKQNGKIQEQNYEIEDAKINEREEQEAIEFVEDKKMKLIISEEDLKENDKMSNREERNKAKGFIKRTLQKIKEGLKGKDENKGR